MADVETPNNRATSVNEIPKIIAPAWGQVLLIDNS
jgi:hypothetical protein